MTRADPGAANMADGELNRTSSVNVNHVLLVAVLRQHISSPRVPRGRRMQNSCLGPAMQETRGVQDSITVSPPFTAAPLPERLKD